MNQTASRETAGGGVNPITLRMLNGPVLPLLLRLASPNALAFLVQTSVSMTEVWYVGQLGRVSLAAMALMFPWLMLMQMLANGAIGGGVTGAIARALGANRVERAEQLIWHALVIAVVAGFGFLGLVLVALEPLLGMMSDDPAVLEQARLYALILFSGCPFIWTMAVLNSTLRGMGNMKFPALLMIIGAVLQIPLSGTLILGWFGMPQLGIAGAAVSVITVSLVSTLLLLIKLRGPTSPLRLTKQRLQLSGELFGSILKVGLPSSISPFLTVGTITGLNVLVGSFGVAALAGYGVGSRIEFLIIPLVFGLGVSMNTMVGVNLGAGEVKRAVHIGWVGAITAGVVTGLGGLSVAIWPEAWAGIFTDDPEVLLSAKAFLQYTGPFFALQGLGLVLFFASQGAGTMTWPLVANFVRFMIAIGGGAVLLYGFSASLETIFLTSGIGMLAVGVITALALKLGMWER